jgi:CubicO group peptidase (beta-lactamase class C family)
MHPSSLAWLVCVAAGPLRTQDPPAADRDLLPVAAAYAAKVMASALFVSGRTQASVLAQELAPDRPIETAIRPLLQFDVDVTSGTVTCRIGPVRATAVATRQLGCTLLPEGTDVAAVRARGGPAIAVRQPDPQTIDWPLGDRVPATAIAHVDHAALGRAIDAAFAERPGRPLVRTRAIAIAHHDMLVAERYAPGFSAEMPLPGWSMSKSLVGALVAIRVHQGRLDLEAGVDLPGLPAGGAVHPTVRLRHLLSMTAGLAWHEDYDDPRSDALRMLFRSADHAGEYARQPRVAPPGTQFCYSSGSTNLICRLLRSTFADDPTYWAFPRTALFDPLGMRSAVLEADASGTFVGSSYGFATARDWVRFGLFLARGGTVGERRLLPDDWLARAGVPAPGSNGRFGWHIWLNADPDADGPGERQWPELPADLLHLDGHEGQYCIVVPSCRFVLVRLGCTKQGGFDLRGLVGAALAACGE